MKRGDQVKASFYRKRGVGREFIAARIGTVELVHKDQVWVRFTGWERPQVFPAADVEVISG